MSSRENEHGNCGKKPSLDGEGEKSRENAGKPSASGSDSKSFNKLLVLD